MIMGWVLVNDDEGPAGLGHRTEKPDIRTFLYYGYYICICIRFQPKTKVLVSDPRTIRANTVQIRFRLYRLETIKSIFTPN